MSYPGLQILYQILNRNKGIWAERVFAPLPQVAEILRRYKQPLCTLESDTPLKDLDILGFSLTHELSYTTVLYILDLAGIPFRSSQRAEESPLLIAGGGAVFNPEPVAPFFDALVLGDGEEVIEDISQRVIQAKKNNLSRQDLLQVLKNIPGVYVPAYFEEQEEGPGLRSVDPDYSRIEKRLVKDINESALPACPVVPFGQAIHDRFNVEIARGCTSGCRFCQAGSIYRPVRERSLPVLDKLLTKGLSCTGFEELSFLSLSTGDFSQLEGLFKQSFYRCQQEQVAISLPSLRAGTISPAIMDMLTRIRRTGATIAPEAGSQRLRDVINKGIDEQSIIEHTQLLFSSGWHRVKLYFMIGLPTETQKDLQAIFDLCCRVLDSVGKGKKRVQITASVSPFVPKAHTPFQWSRQDSVSETKDKTRFLSSLFRSRKHLKLNFHLPEMSFLEGVFSRGDRRLSQVIEQAYSLGDKLTSWNEYFQLGLWLKAFETVEVDPEQYLRAREVNSSLAWDHICTGVEKEFLRSEWDRALQQKQTSDCRYGSCNRCGLCNGLGGSSGLSQQGARTQIAPVVNQRKSDQTRNQSGNLQSPEKSNLNTKQIRLRLWFEKTGPAKYLSQLEMIKVLERIMRRADIPLTFSRGFHPKPLLSFGRALSVGIGSFCEWMEVYLRREVPLQDMVQSLNKYKTQGLYFLYAEPVAMHIDKPQALFEDYQLYYKCPEPDREKYVRMWSEALHKSEISCTYEGKKGLRTIDIRPNLYQILALTAAKVIFTLDWRQNYLNPLTLLRAVNPDISPLDFELCKVKQHFSPATLLSTQISARA